MPFPTKATRKALISIFIFVLPIALVPSALAQSNAYQSLQIQRELLEVEQQRLELEHQRYRREQQQDIDRLQREIVNQTSNIQEKRSALLRGRQEILKLFEADLSALKRSCEKWQAAAERADQEILGQRTKWKLTHPRAEPSTHFTEGFQQPFEKRRRDIDYIYGRYEKGRAELEAILAKFPAVISDYDKATEKTDLLLKIELGNWFELKLIAEYKFYLFYQEAFDNTMRDIRKTSPKDLPEIERSLIEQTRDLVQDFDARAGSDAKRYALWIKSAKQ